MPEKDAVDLWSLSDLCTPWCIHTAATLDVAEIIAAGTQQIENLAAAIGCDAYFLHRMLTHLVRRGVFEEPVPGQFVMNEAAQGLLDPTIKLSLNLEGLGGRFAAAWSTLPKLVRSGKPAYQELFGLFFWEDLHVHPELRADFDKLMGPAGHGEPEPDFPITGGWDSIRSVVDVGGGTGAMLAAILRKRPNIVGTLVDLPKTAASSGEIFQDAGVAERVTTVGQSFFDPLPTGSDLYLLRKVLNDWPDTEAEAILRRCAEAARPAGRVVVMGSVSPDGTPRPLVIEMMLLGGRQRTVSEFQELAHRAGLEVTSTGQQPSGYFVVECRPR